MLEKHSIRTSVRTTSIPSPSPSQRQLNNKFSMVEIGYIGRLIHNEYLPINLNAVPYMMTKGGQQFKNAYANVAVALSCAVSTAACGGNVPAAFQSDGVTPNPAYGAFINGIASQQFFEAALNSSYCTGTFSNGTGTYSNCTAAVVDKELGNITGQNVWSMWSELDGSAFNFPPHHDEHGATRHRPMPWFD